MELYLPYCEDCYWEGEPDESKSYAEERFYEHRCPANRDADEEYVDDRAEYLAHIDATVERVTGRG